MFVRILDGQYDEVLRTNNVVRYISFEGKAVLIPEKQINSIKLIVEAAQNDAYEIHTGVYVKGQQVDIIHGNFKGFSGIVKEVRNKATLAIEIKQLGINISLVIPKEFLMKLN